MVEAEHSHSILTTDNKTATIDYSSFQPVHCELNVFSIKCHVGVLRVGLAVTAVGGVSVSIVMSLAVVTTCSQITEA